MGSFTFNPVLSEIQSHMQAMSPQAQAAVKMANPSIPPPDPTMTQPGVLHPGMLLPHPDTEPPQGNISMPSSSPTLSMPSPQPKMIAPRGTIEGDTNERGRLLSTGSGISQIGSKIENSTLGQAHPFAGRLLGDLAQGAATVGDVALNTLGGGIGRLAAQEIPGTDEHHNLLLNRENKQIGTETGEAAKQAEAAASQAEVPLRQAQTEEAETRTEAATPVEITPEQAEAMGSPELAGEKVSPTIMAQLSKQHGINTTKESTTETTVGGKKDVAQIAADAKDRAEQAQERTREAVARIRASTPKAGAGKGAAGVTNNSKARGEMADTILERAPSILQEIDALNDKIGPGAGRWNNFWVKKGGVNDPDYAGLDQDLGLYASALAVAHFGARGGGQHFIEQLKRDFGQAQSPEDLKARILHADKWMEGYQAEGKGGSPTPAPQAQNDPLGIR